MARHFVIVSTRPALGASARELPELPRPLKNWGALWLVQDILAASDQWLAGQRVEAVPPQPVVRHSASRMRPFSIRPVDQ